VTAESTPAFFTIVRAHDDVAARVLADHLAAVEPGRDLHVVRIAHDGLRGASVQHSGIAQTLGLADLDLGAIALQLWLALPPAAAQTAVALVAMDHFLAQGAAQMTFLAADTVLRAPLDIDPETVGVSPRWRHPRVDDGMTPSPAELAQFSRLDDGLLIASAGASADIAERADAVRAGSVSSLLAANELWDSLALIPDAVFVDDPRVGIAWWNAHERAAILKSDKDPVTLRLPGFDPLRPWVLSSDQGPRPRVVPSDEPVLATLIAAHAADLLARGWDTGATSDRIGSVQVDAAIRAAAMREWRRGWNDPPPVTSGVDLLAWLNGPEPGTRCQQVSRYAMGIWEMHDYPNHAFPNPMDDQAEPFLAWVRLAKHQLGVPLGLVPDDPLMARPDHAVTASLPPGVNLVGFLRAGFGIGEATRLFADALASGEVPHACTSISHDDLADAVTRARADDEPIYDTNLICVNVDWLDAVRRRLGNDFINSRYAIGTWWWESNVLPPALASQLDQFDELWVGSTFIADALTTYTDLPVRVFPLPIPIAPRREPPDRAALGLPDGYLFMFSFDFNSTVERKNPAGVIDAFVEAFEPNEGPVLVIKTINGDRHRNDLEHLRYLVRGRPDIVIFDGFLPADERDAWALACDCYVSLHRCEGFGLTMAEAMAQGKPVIATRYSANLDFMDDSTAYLVDYEPWVLETQAGPYPAGTLWAQPDQHQAAQLMRHVWLNQDEAKAVGEAARGHIAETRTAERLTDFVVGRLEEIRGMDPVQDPNADPSEGRSPAVDDVVRYLGQRQSASGGVINRIVGAAVRPYAAGADELQARTVAAVDETALRAHRIEARVDDLERIASGIASALGDGMRSAEERFRNLERAIVHLNTVAQGAERLHDELYPEVFVTDADGLQITNADGMRVLGYTDSSTTWDPVERYALFEDTFRGGTERVMAGLRPYIEILRDHAPVLDVGSGRGEMLEALNDAGIASSGVDLDPGMVRRARARGLSVVEADGADYLATLPEGALGAIFAAQVIEHLPWPDLQRFLSESRRALRPGGLLVCETVNPHCLRSLKAFWLDPTHQHPIFPEAALVYSRTVGFPSAQIRFTANTGDLARDRRESDSYAVIATA